MGRGGWGLYSGAIIGCIFCLQVDGLITWEACKWAEGAFIQGGL